MPTPPFPGAPMPGTPPRAYQDNGMADHLWRFVDAGSGRSKIVNVNSGKAVAVSGMSTTDGAQVTQGGDNGTPDHLWRLI